ncbi:unnamed protein product [Schistocephalus solidus]|uniref:Uncharacterized protein n=1 Tax=Schistocephalus solidus TaxID=70667 RepID=A0A3P7DQF2_SCHSO|nr:unnamed protein product [Schistocephalus solidus]
MPQVQAVIQSPAADQPYNQLTAALLRLHTVSDSQRYHQLIREECLGDRKSIELLRRMQTLRGELHIDNKLFKEMFLERLPTDVQTILASCSEDFSVSRLAEMADRMLEVQPFQPSSIAQLSIFPLPTPNEHLVTQMAVMMAEMASLKLQLACLTSRRSSSHSPSRRRSYSRLRIVDVCWYHTNFGTKAHQCSSPIPSNPHRETSQPENRAPSTESYVEKGLSNCIHVFVRCDRVRKPLKPPYEGLFCVLSRNAKTRQILHGDKEDVVSVDRVKAAVAEEPPDLHQGQDCADHLPCAPLNFLPPPPPSSLPSPSTPLSPSTPTPTLPVPLTFAPLVAVVKSTFPTALALKSFSISFTFGIVFTSAFSLGGGYCGSPLPSFFAHKFLQLFHLLHI